AKAGAGRGVAQLAGVGTAADFCRECGSGISHRVAGTAGVFAEPHAGASVRTIERAGSGGAGTASESGTRSRAAERLRAFHPDVPPHAAAAGSHAGRESVS